MTTDQDQGLEAKRIRARELLRELAADRRKADRKRETPAQRDERIMNTPDAWNKLS